MITRYDDIDIMKVLYNDIYKTDRLFEDNG